MLNEQKDKRLAQSYIWYDGFDVNQAQKHMHTWSWTFGEFAPIKLQLLVLGPIINCVEKRNPCGKKLMNLSTLKQIIASHGID